MLVDIWPAAVPFLARALKYHPFLTPETLLGVLLRGKASLIVFVDGEVVGAAAMEAMAYPPDLVGNVIALGGVRGFYRTYIDQAVDALERWCRFQNCTKISALGRQGWSRFLARRGGCTQQLVCAWKDLGRP